MIKIFGKYDDIFKHIKINIENSKNDYVIASRDSFFIFDDDELINQFEHEIIQQNGEYILVKGEFIIKYGRYLRNDWNELICTGNGKQYFYEICKSIENDIWHNNTLKDTYYSYNFELIEKGWDVHWILYNWDGVFWEFLTIENL